MMRYVISQFDVNANKLPYWLIFLVFTTLFIVTWAADIVGMTAVLGAFLVGLILPRHPKMISNLSNITEDFSTVFLLPLFFTFSCCPSSSPSPACARSLAC